MTIAIMTKSISFLICFIGVFIRQSVAHFYLNDPLTIGFDDSLEATAPCGSFTVDFTKDNVTDFHVGGNSIALVSKRSFTSWCKGH